MEQSVLFIGPCPRCGKEIKVLSGLLNKTQGAGSREFKIGDLLPAELADGFYPGTVGRCFYCDCLTHFECIRAIVGRGIFLRFEWYPSSSVTHVTHTARLAQGR